MQRLKLQINKKGEQILDYFVYDGTSIKTLLPDSELVLASLDKIEEIDGNLGREIIKGEVNSERYSPNYITSLFNENVNFKFGVVSADELVSAARIDNAEIVLLSDIETNDNFVFIRKITLDLNGKTLKGDGSNGVILAGTGADVTITGNGTIIAKESSDRYAMAVHAILNSKVTIKSGTFTQEITGTDDQYDLIYLEGSAQVTILDGTFKCHTPKWTLNKRDCDVKNAKIIVKGGTFENYNPAKSESENPVENFVAEGYGTVLVDDSTTDYKVVAKKS